MKTYLETPDAIGFEYECADGSTFSLRFDRVPRGVVAQVIHSRQGPLQQFLLTHRQAAKLSAMLAKGKKR